MATESPLKGKTVLVVDDEPDILETLGEILDMCVLHKAGDYDTAVGYLSDNTYDVVVLDIMGVNGFELLNISEARGFPTVMLTAHAVTPEALKRSIELGAVSFIPKEKMSELTGLLEDVVQGGGKRLWWLSSLEKLGDFFDKRFGADWKEKDQIFKDFEASLKAG
ncbi:MAG: response regulator [Deltaproteobacteria bacterium]|nr:response regulator [Deltaproteobacteria bacterium]